MLSFVYSDAYLKYFFGPSHPFQATREKMTFELLKLLGVFGKHMELVQPAIASEEDILSVHEKTYVEFVKKTVNGMLDYGDTPATPTLYEGALWRVGGSLTAAKLAMGGKISFNPGGGLHHSHRSVASGFCVFNDIAISVRYLQKQGFRRIAVIDVDGHHGDGTQSILNEEPVLKVSLHRYDGSFFPGTGRAEDIGEGEGIGYSVNVPLPKDCYDEAYMKAFNEIVLPVVCAYKPEIIINQFGVDSHYGDPLVGMALTTKTYEKIAHSLRGLSKELCKSRLLVLGGGGYSKEDVARSWATVCLALSNAPKELLDKVADTKEPKKPGWVMDDVEKSIKAVKKAVFPYHGLK